MPKPEHTFARFTGKVVLVTGAGSKPGEVGVGRAIAMAFAAEGAIVAGLDLSIDAATETKALIEAEGGKALAFTGDASVEEDSKRYIEGVLDACGRIDVLVNNVGVTGPLTSFVDTDMSRWTAAFDINIKSAALMSRYALPPMIERGGGSIINISSLASLRTLGSSAYGSSKAAMNAFGRELAVAYGRKGIRVNTIAPGHIWTPMAEATGGGRIRDIRRELAPLGVEGDAWDVASASLFLASEEARFITGVVLPVDGGAEFVAGFTSRHWTEPYAERQ